MSINETILSLRRKKGYTQEQLAEMLGVSTAAVSKWECGNSCPDIALLPQIAEIFDVSIDYLFGYDIKKQETVSEIIVKANNLHSESKYDEAEALIVRTLTRYPNNLRLLFELSRHRFINAKHKRKAEREAALKKASEGFEYIAAHDDDIKRRAWSLHFLTSICLINNDYDKASEYNSKLLAVKGVYPRATEAIIEINKSPGEKSFNALREVIYECIQEYSIVLPWLVPYLLSKGDYDTVINENLRAARIFEEFTECRWIYNDILCCYETVAFAYAKKKDYNSCIDYLEKACYYAVEYDKFDHNLTYDLYVTEDVIEKIDENFSSRQSMYSTLVSIEREEYAPIRETERYKNIIKRLINEKTE